MEKPVEFTIGVKRRIFNGAFRDAMTAAGYTYQTLSRRTGITTNRLMAFTAMKMYPREHERDLLTIFLGVSEEVMFPEALQATRLAQQPAEIRYSGKDLQQLLHDGQWLQLPESNPEHDAMVQADARAMLARTLPALTPREREVISLRFGLGGRGEHTFAQIARTIKLSTERVRQLEATALRKFRKGESRRKVLVSNTVLNALYGEAPQ